MSWARTSVSILVIFGLFPGQVKFLEFSPVASLSSATVFRKQALTLRIISTWKGHPWIQAMGLAAQALGASLGFPIATVWTLDSMPAWPTTTPWTLSRKDEQELLVRFKKVKEAFDLLYKHGDSSQIFTNIDALGRYLKLEKRWLNVLKDRFITDYGKKPQTVLEWEMFARASFYECNVELTQRGWWINAVGEDPYLSRGIVYLPVRAYTHYRYASLTVMLMEVERTPSLRKAPALAIFPYILFDNTAIDQEASDVFEVIFDQKHIGSWRHTIRRNLLGMSLVDFQSMYRDNIKQEEWRHFRDQLEFQKANNPMALSSFERMTLIFDKAGTHPFIQIARLQLLNLHQSNKIADAYMHQAADETLALFEQLTQSFTPRHLQLILFLVFEEVFSPDPLPNHVDPHDVAFFCAFAGLAHLLGLDPGNIALETEKQRLRQQMQNYLIARSPEELWRTLHESESSPEPALLSPPTSLAASS